MLIKANWKVWITLIVISIIVSHMSNAVTEGIAKYKEKKTADAKYTTITMDINIDDVFIKNRITRKKIKVNEENILLNVNAKDPDLIISESKKEIEGYAEWEEYLYIPYVMIGNSHLSYVSQECFHKIPEEGYARFGKDIRHILNAMEADKSWEEIGIESSQVVKNGKEKVTLKIPLEYDNSYDEIKKYFILALNNFKNPTKAQLADLEIRVNTILNKCEKVEDISSELNKKTEFYGILFVPESLIAQNLKQFKNNFRVISPGKTMRIKYNVYIKNKKVKSLKEYVVNRKVESIKKILKTTDFLELTGLRNNDYNNIVESKYYKSSFEIFDFVEIDTIELGEVSINESTLAE